LLIIKQDCDALSLVLEVCCLDSLGFGLSLKYLEKHLFIKQPFNAVSIIEHQSTSGLPLLCKHPLSTVESLDHSDYDSAACHLVILV